MSVSYIFKAKWFEAFGVINIYENFLSIYIKKIYELRITIFFNNIRNVSPFHNKMFLFSSLLLFKNILIDK